LLKSAPSKLLLIATAATVAAAIILPALPFAVILGFSPMPAQLYIAIAGIILLYVIAAETVKRAFYSRLRAA
jgi:Mg2+-importing ATPase